MHSTPRTLAREALRKRHAPSDGTVASFVRWMQALGETREFNLFDAYEFYESTCAIQGHRQMTKHKRFKEAMRLAGCVVWQGDEVIGGIRTRPMKVRIPATSAKANSTPATRLPTTAKRLPKALLELSAAA